MIMSSDECYSTLLMISQQAITWISVDQDLQRHMASLGPNELIHSSHQIVGPYGKTIRRQL